VRSPPKVDYHVGDRSSQAGLTNQGKARAISQQVFMRSEAVEVWKEYSSHKDKVD
jgi:hypothetical protein